LNIGVLRRGGKYVAEFSRLKTSWTQAQLYVYFADMDYQRFTEGFDIETYAKNIRNYRSVFKRLLSEAQASDEHAHTLREVTATAATPVYLSVVTEDWCGDSCCNIPILADLAKKADLEIRVFRGSEHPDLEKRYTDEGDDHIPVVSVWDGEGGELARWIEAPEAVEQKKAAWKEAHPDFMPLFERRDSDPDAAKQFAALYREFLEEMAGWYVDGLWKETTRELVEKVKE
jgi:hypothetical protein